MAQPNLICKWLHRWFFWQDCWEKDRNGYYVDGSHYYFCTRCFKAVGSERML